MGRGGRRGEGRRGGNLATFHHLALEKESLQLLDVGETNIYSFLFNFPEEPKAMSMSDPFLSSLRCFGLVFALSRPLERLSMFQGNHRLI